MNLQFERSFVKLLFGQNVQDATHQFHINVISDCERSSWRSNEGEVSANAQDYAPITY